MFVDAADLSSPRKLYSKDEQKLVSEDIVTSEQRKTYERIELLFGGFIAELDKLCSLPVMIRSLS